MSVPDLLPNHAGIYFVLAAICIHFLLKRRTETRSQKIILGYTICMLVITTIYFVSGCVWSEIEFVEATVDISVFDTLQSSSLAILKDTAYVVNIWLADSLLVRDYHLLQRPTSPILAGVSPFHRMGGLYPSHHDSVLPVGRNCW